MDITPIYELKTRLRSAAIAGTSLLSEDFRLKKAAENIASLSSASPVFAKINEMTGKLLSDGSPDALLDTITLVDAVITTLGTVGVTGELEPLDVTGCSTVIVNAPYSRLSAVIDALETTGSGNYNTILNTRNENPELFNDYRVKPALVRGLGASYSELADTVANILKGMGKEVIPLIKKDFDPKGKKETIRRVNVIEEICGAEENDFYLEQLEFAEKDTRKALIYALRHDEKNADKLIELTKTEKGKLKTAALAALMSFDCEKSAEFFEEYAKKKPAEVISLLERASSEWTSRLAARLIDEALVDENGSKITLSQAADVDKVKLKVKTSFWELNSALWGKWGADIEKIYREFCHKDRVVSLDVRLSESILKTDNEGLKALARELNSAKATKGCYVCAEAVTRLLSNDDSSRWFEERITEAYKARHKDQQAVNNSAIIKVLRKIVYENGRYYLKNTYYDPISDVWLTNALREISDLVKGAVSDALMKCPCHEYYRLLGDWIDANDSEYCQRVGEFFLRHNDDLNTPDLIEYITRCGMRNVKGLLVKECKVYPQMRNGTVMFNARKLPGDDEYRIAEVRELVEALKKGKLKMPYVSADELSLWAESGMK